MKTQLIFKSFLCIAFLSMVGNACVKDLDTVPLDKDVVTAAVVFDDPASYLAVLAKLYAGLAVTGQQGAAGQPDIEGIDEGFGQYLRMYWYHQVLTTDEAVIGWNDQTIKDFHEQDWSADDGFVFALYSRIFYQIVLCNEFLRETTEEKLNSRGVDATLAAQIQGYRAEARFLRALSYWHALDLFRNVPFVTEDDVVGLFFPEQILGPDLFAYIESELLAIENEIAAPRTNAYGRADQGAVWALLAKLYLNAEVYIQTPKFTECVTYCNKVINGGYTLEPVYQNLFLADNDKSNEIIFPIRFDGVNTRTWGGTTMIIRAGIGGSMNPVESGVASGWGGTRTTKQFVAKFPVATDRVVDPSEGNTASYTKIYVPGEYQGWVGTNTKTALTSVLNNKIYEGHIYFPTDNSPFFFTLVPSSSFAQRVGDNGGDGTLENNGDTIRAGVAGLYYIQVDRNTNTYIMERRSWGIIGDATTNGWNSDQDMTWDAGSESMEININLTPGQFKFRSNDDWAVNLGDDLANAILTQDGDSIHIGGGTFRIRLFLDKPDYTYEIKLTSFDRRGLFYIDGQNIEIEDVSLFTDGYAIRKFKNVTSTGAPGKDSDFPDTDFPVFRLGDVLLMASEALVRGGGDRGLALNYFNQVRNRAYLGAGGNITDADLTLQTLIDERARELYWEAHRRTDLIRFNQFSESNYVWAWKGGVPEGKSIEAYRNLFPIPTSDLGANPQLDQNDGY